MELAVEMIHLAVIAAILFPKLIMLCNMESADVGLIELLHLSYLQQSIEIIADALIPFQRSSLLNSSNDIIRFDNILRNLRHILSQYALVDAREALRVQKFFYIQRIKSFN